MKLVKEISKRRFLSSSWGIYELSDEQTAKYGKRYAMSQGVFSDYALENTKDDTLLEGLKEHLYEGFFDTVKEAVLTVENVGLRNKIYELQNGIRNLYSTAEKDDMNLV